MTREIVEVDCDNFIVTEVAVPPTIITVDDGSCVIQIEDDTFNVVRVEEQTTVVTEGPTEFVIAECKQGPAGPPGADGSGVIEVDFGTVTDGNTEVVDSVLRGVYRSVKWIATLTDSAGMLYKSYEVMAVHNGTVAFHSCYGRVGDTIAVDTDVVVTGANLELSITNNHGSDIEVKVQRIATTI